jgi:uncharacterized membrane protein YidH (DUF202 family)
VLVDALTVGILPRNLFGSNTPVVFLVAGSLALIAGVLLLLAFSRRSTNDSSGRGRFHFPTGSLPLILVGVILIVVGLTR